MYKKEQYNQEIWYNIAVEILMDLVDLNMKAIDIFRCELCRDPYGSRGSKLIDNLLINGPLDVEILMDLVDLNIK